MQLEHGETWQSMQPHGSMGAHDHGGLFIQQELCFLEGWRLHELP